jgi:hypothetical protein
MNLNITQTLQKVTFTITMRRPPRLFVPLLYPSGKSFVVDNSEAGKKSRDVTTRQGTSVDFVNVGGPAGMKTERDEGQIPVFSEQELFKVGLIRLVNNPDTECRSCCVVKQVGGYLSYRFTLLLTTDEHDKLRKLLGDLGILAKDVLSPQGIDEFNPSHHRTPGINHGMNGTRADVVPIILTKPERIQRRKLGKPLPFPKGDLTARLLPGVLRKLPFATRFLIEGLVSHGIILPFEAFTLIDKLEEFIPLKDRQKLGKSLGRPGWEYEGRPEDEPQILRERVLGSLFIEDRVKDMGSLVMSKLGDQVAAICSCC